jgi:arginine repressor
MKNMYSLSTTCQFELHLNNKDKCRVSKHTVKRDIASLQLHKYSFMRPNMDCIYDNESEREREMKEHILLLLSFIIIVTSFCLFVCLFICLFVCLVLF